MASKKEFETSNNIIKSVKGSDEGNLLLWDVLDTNSISLSWWKDHKKWFFHRHPYMRLQEIDGLLYLVHDIEREPKIHD